MGENIIPKYSSSVCLFIYFSLLMCFFFISLSLSFSHAQTLGSPDFFEQTVKLGLVMYV